MNKKAQRGLGIRAPQALVVVPPQKDGEERHNNNDRRDSNPGRVHEQSTEKKMDPNQNAAQIQQQQQQPTPPPAPPAPPMVEIQAPAPQAQAPAPQAAQPQAQTITPTMVSWAQVGVEQEQARAAMALVEHQRAELAFQRQQWEAENKRLAEDRGFVRAEVIPFFRFVGYVVTGLGLLAVFSWAFGPSTPTASAELPPAS